MNIVIYHSFETGNPLEEKARLFVRKKGKSAFLLCEYIQKENIPKWIERQEEILRWFNIKISGGTLEESRMNLFNKDKIFLRKLLVNYEKSQDKEKFRMNTNKIFALVKVKTKLFLEKYIDKFVIPTKDIVFELWSSLNTYLQNISDAKTIASGIQEHQENKLVLITADKKDWNKENLEASIPPYSDLRKKYPSLPKIEYLQNFS